MTEDRDAAATVDAGLILLNGRNTAMQEGGLRDARSIEASAQCGTKLQRLFIVDL